MNTIFIILISVSILYILYDYYEPTIEFYQVVDTHHDNKNLYYIVIKYNKEYKDRILNTTKYIRKAKPIRIW